MDKARGVYGRSAVNIFDSSVFITFLILSVFSALIFFQPATNAYSQDGFNCQAVPNPVINCGFETGDFAGWVTQDLSDPFFPLQVGGAGLSPGFGFFTSDPTQGIFAALTGFDGNGPGTISVAQDVVLSPGAETLVFDYRCAWDLLNEADATLSRIFEVNIEPSGGGAPLQTTVILTALPDTVAIPDTGGNQTGVVDLTEFSGQAVRISFDWIVPEDFTGPAFCQLDNVFIDGGVQFNVPTLSEWGMIFTAGTLGILGLIALRRRQALRS